MLVACAAASASCARVTQTEPQAIATVAPSAALAATPTTTREASPSPSGDAARVPSIAWKRHVLPDGALRTVIRGDDRFIAVGSVDDQEDSVWESEDGLAWGSLARRPFGNDRPWSVTLQGDRLIVVALTPFGDGSQTAVWSSPDGTAWEPWVEPKGFRHPRAFARFQDQWLMQSVSDAGIDVSQDGVDWTRKVVVVASEAAGFAHGPGGIIAGYTLDDPISFQAAAFHSTDGEEWSQALLDGRWAILDRVAANASVYVGLGKSRLGAVPFTGAAWWSPDGMTWERATVPSSFGIADWTTTSVVAIDEAFIALAQLDFEGQVGLLWSADGRAWTFLEPIPSMSLNETSLVVDGDRLLIYGIDPDAASGIVVWEGSISR